MPAGTDHRVQALRQFGHHLVHPGNPQHPPQFLVTGIWLGHEQVIAQSVMTEPGFLGNHPDKFGEIRRCDPAQVDTIDRDLSGDRIAQPRDH